MRSARKPRRPLSDVRKVRAAGRPVPTEAPTLKTKRFLRNIRRKRIRSKKKSGLEIRVEAALDARGIEYRTQYPIGRCHADLYFPQTNTVVELHGCYWHAHSVCQKTFRYKRRRVRDARRYTFFRNKGYQLLIVWECEVNQNLQLVMDRLSAAAAA